MRSKTLLVALWLVGTALAATVAWQSLTFVSASTEAEFAAPTQPAVDRSGATSSVPVEPSSDRATGTEGSAGSTSKPVGRAGEANGTEGAETVDDPAPSSADLGSSDSGPSGSIDETFDLIGGQVAIRFNPTEVKVLWFTPAPGYIGSSHPEHGGVEVEFDNGVHESKIEAWWDDGPRTEVREKDDD